MLTAVVSALDTSYTTTLAANTARLVPVPPYAKFVQFQATGPFFVIGGNLSSIAATTTNSTISGSGSTTEYTKTSIYVDAAAGSSFELSLSGVSWLSLKSTGTPTIGMTFGTDY